MKQDIVELKQDVGELKHKVSNIERSMTVATVKAKNALLGPMDTILKLPLPNGIVTETEYPPTITHLAVSGSECLPNGGGVNTWNAKKR